MAVRQWLTQNPRTATGVFSAITIVAIGAVVMQVMGARQKFPTKQPDSFFSTDDGKTYFPVGSENIPPFDYKGQQAVRAYVFECGGKRFVGYLERYTPDARKKLVEQKDVTPQVQISGRELKKPGESTWVKSGDFVAAGKVANVICPDGRAAEPIEP